MAKIYGALEVAQLEWFTDAGKPAPASYIYRVIYVSDLKQVQVSDGTNWIAFLNTSTNQTLAGDITFTGAQIFSGQHRLSVTTNSSTGAIVALAATTPVIEFTGAVTSIAGIASGASGATVMLVNRSGNSFQVLDEGAGASASNRIRTGAGNITLANNASVLLTYVGDNRWHVVGGSGSGAGAGGAKNYYTVSSANSNFAQNTVSPWSAATLTLSGGVPTGAPTLTATQMAIATTATNPLLTSESLYNMQLTKSAANAQGQGFISGVLTIDREDVAKVLTGSFTYEVVSGTIDLSGTSTQSLEIWVYNVTANQWIQPAGFRGMNQSSGVGQVTFTFQTDGTPANVQYRVAVITAQTSTSAYVVNFNDFKIGPQTAPIGAVMTDWANYTPTLIGVNGVAYTNQTTTGQWRRVGDSIELLINSSFTGTPASGTSYFRWTLPTGLSADTTKVSSVFGAVGVARAFQAAYYTGTVFYETATTVAIAGDTGTGNFWGASSPAAFANTHTISFTARIPVVGFSSNVQLSNDTDTRVVSMTAGRAQAAVTAGSNITGFNLFSDTHGAFNASTGIYTIPVTGDYTVSVVSAVPVTGSTTIITFYDGSQVAATNTATGGATRGGSSILLAGLPAGKQIFFRPDTSVTLTNELRISINRLSGPSVIAASETVAAAYWGNSAQSIPVNVDSVAVSTPARVFDTHNMWSAGTGYNSTTGTWTTRPGFTVPVSGKYLVTFSCGIALPASLTLGTIWSEIGHIRSGTVITTGAGNRLSGNFQDTFTSSGALELNCLAGDYIGLFVFQSTGAARNTVAESRHTRIEIVRVGN